MQSVLQKHVAWFVGEVGSVVGVCVVGEMGTPRGQAGRCGLQIHCSDAKLSDGWFAAAALPFGKLTQL